MDIKEEAIERMKMLKLHQNIINEFRNENKLNRSELGLGILYWLDDNEKQLVADFEKTHEGYIVYHLIKTNTADFGTIYDLLYVDPHEEDWKAEREDLKQNLISSYTATQFAECGLIKVKCINGGLARVY